MKYLVATATFAMLIAALPASAQTVTGSTVAPSGILVGVDPESDVYWKQNFVINSAVESVTPASNAVSAPGAFDVLANNGAGQGLDNFSVTGTTNAVAPVPEPATWAMMLVGFGALGGALRSRRKAILPYA